MEKNGTKSKSGKCFGLLILYCLIFFRLSSVSAQDFNFQTVTVQANSEYFFTQEECSFTLQLKNVRAYEVQAELNDLPLGVKFISSKKSEFFDDFDEIGTEISFWLVFSEAGNYRIPPLIAKINGTVHYIPFEIVKVYENPALTVPVLSVNFNNIKNFSSVQGTEIKFTVYVQYCTQVLGFNWKLPKNSIFSEVNRYDMISEKSKITEFTPKKIPLADFSWKPLSDGIYKLPEITAEVVAYNGSRRKLFLPETEIKILKKQNVSSSPDNDFDILSKKNYNYLRESFEPKDNSETSKETSLKNSDINYEMLYEDAKKIALMESKKKNIFSKFFSKKLEAVTFCTELRQIPEENARKQDIPPLKKVTVIEKTAKWCFVTCDDFSGWVEADKIVPVN